MKVSGPAGMKWSRVMTVCVRACFLVGGEADLESGAGEPLRAELVGVLVAGDPGCPGQCALRPGRMRLPG